MEGLQRERRRLAGHRWNPRWGGGVGRDKLALLFSYRRDFRNFVLRATIRFVCPVGGRIAIRHAGADDCFTGYHILVPGSGDYPIGEIGRLTVNPPT